MGANDNFCHTMTKIVTRIARSPASLRVNPCNIAAPSNRLPHCTLASALQYDLVVDSVMKKRLLALVLFLPLVLWGGGAAAPRSEDAVGARRVGDRAGRRRRRGGADARGWSRRGKGLGECWARTVHRRGDRAVAGITRVARGTRGAGERGRRRDASSDPRAREDDDRVEHSRRRASRKRERIPREGGREGARRRRSVHRSGRCAGRRTSAAPASRGRGGPRRETRGRHWRRQRVLSALRPGPRSSTYIAPRREGRVDACTRGAFF